MNRNGVLGFFHSSNAVRLLCCLIFCACEQIRLPAQTNTTINPSSTNNALVMIQGTVEVARAGKPGWSPGTLNELLYPGDHVRTGERSRAEVYLSGGMTIKKDELSELEIPPSAGVTFKSGIFQIFRRNRNAASEFNLPGATAAVRGTDFLVRVNPDGQSELTVLDGLVALRNGTDEISLTNRERGIVGPNSAIRKTAVIETDNRLIQWSLYYPAVLNVDELEFSAAEKTEVFESLNAYRSGDLLEATKSFPWAKADESDAMRVYRAALLLSVGQVEKSENILATVKESSQSRALKELIDVTRANTSHATEAPSSSSEWLAESYRQQADFKLERALAVAREAAGHSDKFGFAWERVAELEFSFGRTSEALAALEKALELSPRNAQAIALKGFLLSAQNKIPPALEWFDRAIEADSALANAWLGRGLCRIHQGHSTEGLRDLMVAASLEPQRSLLRSYLGKAFIDAGDDAHAVKELKLARELDANDPTSWLYLALLKQQENRINDALRDLQASQDRNDNRSLFRSRLLLDQDRAVGSANLASIYRDLGMTDVSVREASKAVTYDYSNPSAHLFLSDAYNDLRDPTRFNLRYETVWFNELLLANLLAPVGGGRLSQGLSQQEYSKLFQADGLGLASSIDARTDRMYHEQASQFGTFDNTAYSLDLDYQHNDGVRPNNVLNDIEWYTTIKQQVTPQDTALVLIKYEDYHSGDNFQYYDQNQARTNFSFDEYQHPIVVGAWHHEWAPGMHTLLLGGRLVDEQYFSDTATPQLALFPVPPALVTATPLDANYHSTFEIGTVELNQICEWERVTVSAGARYQEGTFQTQDLLSNPPAGQAFLFNIPPAMDSADDHFERVSGYGYLTVEPIERLWLTGGVAYDEVTYPENFRHPPISSGEDQRSQVGPKAAVVWSPCAAATVRGIYTRSLGGVSLDESYRLEPTELAGFPQAFRSLISESVTGSLAAPSYETLGLALDLKLGARTYAGVQVERLRSNVRQDIGIFLFPGDLFPATTASTPEFLDYKEYTMALNLNQLVGDDFVFGAEYKFDQADLHDILSEIPVSALATADQRKNSILHQIIGYILYNHPSGFFAKAETDWYAQHNSGFTPVEPGDEFFQQNFYIGYRLAHRRVECLLGLLNVTGQNYHLEPLTIYQELPRKRVLEARLNVVF